MINPTVMGIVGPALCTMSAALQGSWLKASASRYGIKAGKMAGDLDKLLETAVSIIAPTDQAELAERIAKNSGIINAAFGGAPAVKEQVAGDDKLLKAITTLVAAQAGTNAKLDKLILLQTAKPK
jgi:hypothetical protein